MEFIDESVYTIDEINQLTKELRRIVDKLAVEKEHGSYAVLFQLNTRKDSTNKIVRYKLQGIICTAEEQEDWNNEIKKLVKKYG